MADDDKRWDELVAAVSTVSVKEKKLYRAVAQLSFEKRRQYLFTSGRRNRCNPAGVLCVYMADDRDTALTDDKDYTDLGNIEPCVLYTGRLTSGALIDLEDPTIRDHSDLRMQTSSPLSALIPRKPRSRSSAAPSRGRPKSARSAFLRARCIGIPERAITSRSLKTPSKNQIESRLSVRPTTSSRIGLPQRLDVKFHP